ncbi:hypothetical protein [Pseudophaeobacter flagellatus]|uniref:hypothetical protein n=1 Tax=Pseudophaeobacter flagellatus TaxID=2899119 RepID=UPI001E35542F|nr:hypothetical protein [Pseudophaeobacter flagellatus]MCD9149415.1 hypothetical protein [Pseudophaeobacter flagellatus]
MAKEMPAALHSAALVCLLSFSGVTSAGAQSLEECDWVASARNLVEPWQDTTRTYANGAIRVALLDTGGEPTCCSNHLLILSPHPDYGQACHVLSRQPGLGFRQVFLDAATRGYDPSKGVLISVPVGLYDPDTGGVDTASVSAVHIRINQSLGLVGLEQAALSQAAGAVSEAAKK